jgi:hypothetical protein
MIIIPPISSVTANAVRNILRLNGTRLPSRASTDKANAISVAIGIAAPRESGEE